MRTKAFIKRNKDNNDEYFIRFLNRYGTIQEVEEDFVRIKKVIDQYYEKLKKTL